MKCIYISKSTTDNIPVESCDTLQYCSNENLWEVAVMVPSSIRLIIAVVQ